MSDEPVEGVDPAAEEVGTPGVLNIPLVSMAGCGLRVDTFPDGQKMLVLGPVAIGIPCGPEVIDWVDRNLVKDGSPVIIAPAHAIPKSRGR